MLYHHSTYAKKKPDTTAYIMAKSGETVTWGQLNRRINRLVRYFTDIGLKPGDHIALCMENNARYFEITGAAGDANTTTDGGTGGTGGNPGTAGVGGAGGVAGVGGIGGASGQSGASGALTRRSSASPAPSTIALRSGRSSSGRAW